MAENSKKEEQASFVQKHKDNLQFIYLLLGCVAALGGFYQFVYKKEPAPASAPQQQVIVLRDSSNRSNAPIQQTEKVVERVIVEKSSTPTPQASIENNKTQITPQPEPEVLANTPTNTPPPTAPVPENSFGIVKNTNRKGEVATVKTVVFGGYVMGDYNVATGNTIKVRLTEDTKIENITLTKATLLVGTMTVKGDRVLIEFKDNKNVPYTLYALDKDKNTGLPYQAKFGDGFKIFITNKY